MLKTYRSLTKFQIAEFIDHSVLKPNALEAEIVAACQLASEFHTATVCIRPMDVALASTLLEGSGVEVATVIGFPHGTTTTVAKVMETMEAVRDGAKELDMVLNISALLDGRYDVVQNDMIAVVKAAESGRTDAVVKVIFETGYLTENLIADACQMTLDSGAHFVKTSTGFGPRGASIEDIKLMHEQVGLKLGIKASGGVRTLDQLIDFVEAGATRVGCSNTAAIFDEFEKLAQPIS